MANPTFQHRRYKAIADLIAHTKPVLTQKELSERFASFFAADNGNFSHDRFMAACEGRPINGRDKVR